MDELTRPAACEPPGPPCTHPPPVMLSRTADNLFWLARYMRARRFRRPHSRRDAAPRLPALQLWRRTQRVGGRRRGRGRRLAAFDAARRVANEDTVRDFLAFGPDNPSSIRNCIETARDNARAVRTALTVEMWDAINGAWLELQQLEPRADDARGVLALPRMGQRRRRSPSTARPIAPCCATTPTGSPASALAIERADNTARILDVKYHLLLPETSGSAGRSTISNGPTILREVSALTAYHWVYRESVKPWLVADLLILNRQLPRSLANCYEILVRHLDLIARPTADAARANGMPQHAGPAVDDAHRRPSFQQGLHEFVDRVHRRQQPAWAPPSPTSICCKHALSGSRIATHPSTATSIP